jgi:allophanate hydrolase
MLDPGDRLRIGPLRGPLRGYLAVAGGVVVAPQLGSRSTSLRGAAAGILGRPLRAGDALPLGPASPLDEAGPPCAGPPPWFLQTGPLRLCWGPQADVLSGAGRTALLEQEWRVSPASDRTGVRLLGRPLERRRQVDVPSQGCPPGAIQVSGEGLPILLGCERGTTGGYAIVATLASVDLPRLARLRPGEVVRFAAVDVPTAARLRRRRAARLATLAGRSHLAGAS